MSEDLVVRRAEPGDVSAFTAWAAEVESLFGPMVGVPAFEAALSEALAAGAGLVARGWDGRPLGGILVDAGRREIGWLVVGAAARGSGAGRALLVAALDLLGPGPVGVETFADGVPEGVAARRLYARFEFLPTGEAGETPAGIPTQRLRRSTSTR